MVQEMDGADVMLSESVVAAEFNVKPLTVARWVKRGIFPKPVRIGRTKRYSKKAVEARKRAIALEAA